MLDKSEVREIVNRYLVEIKKVIEPNAVLIFGSYINGNPHEYSDIDVAIIVEGFNGDWYDTMVELGKLRHKVSFEIEPHLLDPLHDRSGFVEHVLKTGEYIYKAA